MSDPAYALQVGQAAALLGDDAVATFVGANVFDELSAQDSVYDRVGIGDDQVIADNITCGNPSEVYSTVHLWCAGADARLKAKRLGEAVRAVLSRPFALTGHTLVTAVFHDARYLPETDPTQPDGQVCHGVLTFRYRTNPNPI